jgi:hypothetical protein
MGPRWLAKYGERLLFVRYRRDTETRARHSALQN